MLFQSREKAKISRQNATITENKFHFDAREQSKSIRRVKNAHKRREMRLSKNCSETEKKSK